MDFFNFGRIYFFYMYEYNLYYNFKKGSYRQKNELRRPLLYPLYLYLYIYLFPDVNHLLIFNILFLGVFLIAMNEISHKWSHNMRQSIFMPIYCLFLYIFKTRYIYKTEFMTNYEINIRKTIQRRRNRYKYKTKHIIDQITMSPERAKKYRLFKSPRKKKRWFY